MPTYVALIHKEPVSDYGVSFPDLPGCVTAGETLDDARVMAAEALALHLCGMQEDGEAIPAPSTLESIMSERQNRDAVAFMVSADLRPARAMRVNITLPEDVLAQIDAYAEQNGFTRSGLIATAAKRMLNA